MTLLKPVDVVKAGYCIAGLRRVYPNYGLTKEDFRTFVLVGLDVEKLSGIDDVMVHQSIKCAEEREAAEALHGEE